LALELARRRHPAFAGVRRVAHVFRVTYEAVDTELPALIARELRVAAFIHVPKVRRAQVQRPRAALTLDDLARAGEAIVRTALAAARPFGADKPPIP